MGYLKRRDGVLSISLTSAPCHPSSGSAYHQGVSFWRGSSGRIPRIYVRAGIADYWIMNLRLDAVEVLRDPQGGLYRTRLVFHRGETISPLARPEVSIAVDDLLPRKGLPVA